MFRARVTPRTAAAGSGRGAALRLGLGGDGSRHPDRDALAVPVVVVVQVDDHRGQDQALLAALGAAPDRPLQAVEQAIEALGVELADLLGKAIDALEGRAQRAGGARAVVVLAEGLIRPLLRPEADRLRQSVLVVSDGLLHQDDPPPEMSACSAAMDSPYATARRYAPASRRGCDGAERRRLHGKGARPGPPRPRRGGSADRGGDRGRRWR